MEAKRLDKLSVEEYIQIEREKGAKYEYHDGKIFAMAGGTIEHGLISGNTYGELKFGLRNKKSDCKAINNDVKLNVEAANKFLYPDVMVVCGEIERSKIDENSITNPIVIIEVLSKSTESYDRGDKFFAYRQIKSLKEYILIDQYQAQVDVYTRQSDLWKIIRITGIEESFYISSIDLSISLKNIYEDITFVKK